MSLQITSVNDAASTYDAASVKNTKEVVSEKQNQAAEVGATFEKTDESTAKKATYSINKMSAEDRQAIVAQLKADQEERQSQLQNLVAELLGQQGKAFTDANDMWKFLAKGDFTVDPATKAQAQADIAEDGYWGVTKTAQRMFDFASALAGDDEGQMRKMQDAMMKGFEQAKKTWGGELPEISQKTIDAANQLFEDFYASKA